jgi:NADH-quinone oxidoreductase subunit G
VVAQIAPAVRVALGECFGLPAGALAMGQIVAALRAMGFDKVFDTCFAADLTVLEEGTELLKRVNDGGVLPQFSSCCPGWVKFAEQYYPDLLPNLSSCRSPQQMFGSLAKATLPAELQVERKDLVIVSIMPCTAKKFEAKRPEFSAAGDPDVDWVVTTQELAAMVQGAGLDFASLQPESLDMPLGFKTGAGVIFGNSGGVSEAVLRFAAEQLTGVKLDNADFPVVRGNEGVLEATVKAGDAELKLAIVHGLANARALAEKVRAGEADYHFIEVMACPGGCIGGAGQPISHTGQARAARTQGLYATDKTLQLHKAQENPYLVQCYQQCLGEPCSHTAHTLLHTHYQSRKRISDEDLSLVAGGAAQVVPIRVCVGTSCFVRGAQDLLHALVDTIEERGLQTRVDIAATFCFERCDRGPSVQIGEQVLEHCTLEMALEALERELALLPAEG